MNQRERTLLHGRHPLAVCREVVDLQLHPEDVDVDTGTRVLPLVLDDRRQFILWFRLYSRALAARNLFLGGEVERALWEIDAALSAAADPPAFLESVYLDELRLLLRSARRALEAGQTGIDHYGPYAALTVAENWCVMRLLRRQVHPVS